MPGGERRGILYSYFKSYTFQKNPIKKTAVSRGFNSLCLSVFAV
jgi:hypothetical protein